MKLLNQKGLTHIFIILGSIAIIGIVGIVGVAYYLGTKSNQSPIKSLEDSSTQSTSKMMTSEEVTNLKLYQGQFVDFQYPQDWNPTKGELSGGAILETINLGIPGVEADQNLGFSEVNFEDLKPNDVLAEKEIRVGGKDGFKWMRKGDNYVSYDYVTKGRNNEGSFSIHITLSKADEVTESQLDKVAQSVIFK